ncbi:hypothetical protein [uncultured Brachyspira sp.]|uniref:hypothetical protein n=1 Tax=uncultured Brachyspira sp. TaxID=221953 RepID=UPI002611B516|nr:hypothetical protein [uncultured Brachyspira sp.]
MKDIEYILGEEKVIHNIHDDDSIMMYIKSFDNVSYCDYFYEDDSGGLMGLFSYYKADKYFFVEFASIKENREYNKLVVNDYAEYITSNDYELTNDKFIDILNISNVRHDQFIKLIRKAKLNNIKSYPIKKISLDEYIEVYPHRYINNRFKSYIKDKYLKVDVKNIADDYVYRCPYCGATNYFKIVNENTNKLESVNVYNLDDENVLNNFYVCNMCNLIMRSPENMLDYI